MRPAKSFWKKVQDWRMTCQWLCQRTRSTRFGVDRVVAHQRVGRRRSSGRSSTTASMRQQRAAVLGARAAPGGVVASMPTIQPTKTGSIASATEPTATSRKRAIERAAELAAGSRRRSARVAGRRLPVGGERGRGIEVVETGGDAVEHGCTHRAAAAPDPRRGSGSGSAPFQAERSSTAGVSRRGIGRDPSAGVCTVAVGVPSARRRHSAASATAPTSMKPPDWRFQKRA